MTPTVDGVASVARAVAWRTSAAVRVLPDFLILGAQKAGTTSLYDVLCASPHVLAARKKEVRFFDRYWSRGTRWYRWSFPTRLAVSARRGVTLVGEATPDYLVHPLAPARAASVVPAARLIVLLRHPVDRAHSQYRMNLTLGTEHRSFDDAVADELARFETRAAGDERWDDQRNFHSYVERSRYQPQLARWLAHYPRPQLHVATLESILAQPDQELARIGMFLGIGDLDRTGEFAHSNRREYDDLDPKRRADLFDLFADDVARTEDLLGITLGYEPT